MYNIKFILFDIFFLIVLHFSILHARNRWLIAVKTKSRAFIHPLCIRPYTTGTYATKTTSGGKNTRAVVRSQRKLIDQRLHYTDERERGCEKKKNTGRVSLNQKLNPLLIRCARRHRVVTAICKEYHLYIVGTND